MRTPLKELLRSLVAGEAPRGDRRMPQPLALGAYVECVGVVNDLRDEDGVLLVEMTGEWSITDLDADGFPLAVESIAGAGCIALGVEHRDALQVGVSVHARSTSTLTHFESSVS